VTTQRSTADFVRRFAPVIATFRNFDVFMHGEARNAYQSRANRVPLRFTDETGVGRA